MTNREWLIKHCNPYDILILMMKQRGDCVIDDIDNVILKDCCRLENSPFDNCEECIRSWLNKERNR